MKAWKRCNRQDSVVGEVLEDNPRQGPTDVQDDGVFKQKGGLILV